MRRRLSAQKRALVAEVLEDDAPSPTFVHYFDGSTGGTDQLSATLTINSLSQTPSFRYRAKDATPTAWTAWGYGEDLAVAGSGTAPEIIPAPFHNNYDQAVRLVNGGKYYESPTAANGDIGAGDVVFELIILCGDTDSRYLLYKHSTHSSTLATGWYLYDRIGASQHYLQLNFDQASAANVVSTSDYLYYLGWVHVLFRWDRDGGYQYCVNGVTSYNAVTTPTATVSNDEAKMTIGAATGQSDFQIAYVAMWERASWFNYVTHANDFEALAKSRFQALIGLTANKALGTATPTTAMRATVVQTAGTLVRYIDGKAQYFSIGGDRTLSSKDAWIRTSSHKESTTGRIRTGILIEPARTNLVTNSAAFGSWTGTGVASTSSDALDGPINLKRADTLVEDTSNGVHGYSQSPSITSGTTYAFSVFAKAQTRTLLRLYVDTVTASAYFDLSAGTVGTTANVVSSGIQECINGWYRCWIVYTATASAATAHRIHAADAGEDDTYQGIAATSAISLFGAQVEAGLFPSTLIYTFTGTAARDKDQLVYPGGDNVGGTGAFNGNVVCKALSLAPYNNDAAKTALCVDDSTGATANRIEIEGVATDDAASGVVASAETGGSVTVTDATPIDICDGNEHAFRLRARASDTALYVDGVLRTQSASASTPPNALDEIRIGEDDTASAQFGGLIYDVKVFG